MKPETEEVLILDDFDSTALPSLEDLMQEFAAEESEFNETTVGEPCAAPEAKPHNDAALALQLERENQELNAALKRVQSDFENYRRRVERERSEHYAYALITVVKELLPVLDNFRIALKNAAELNDENNLNDFFAGFELILLQLERVLSSMGVQQIPAKGETFNPQFHEAVSVEPSQADQPNTILEELARGYRLGNKLIRPALVKVSTQA